MYISSDIPSNFNRIADITDNYIVLVKEQILNNNSSYEAYIQFFNPSTNVIHLTNYKITIGNNYTYNYTYNQNQYWSYIDHMDLTFTKTTYPLTDISTNLWDRADISNILVMVGLLLALTILIVNLATSLVHRGGDIPCLVKENYFLSL